MASSGRQLNFTVTRSSAVQGPSCPGLSCALVSGEAQGEDGHSEKNVLKSHAMIQWHKGEGKG